MDFCSPLFSEKLNLWVGYPWTETISARLSKIFDHLDGVGIDLTVITIVPNRLPAPPSTPQIWQHQQKSDTILFGGS